MSSIDRAVESYTRQCFRDAYEGRREHVNRCDTCGKPISDDLAICESCYEKEQQEEEAAMSYLQEFKSSVDVIDQYKAPSDALDGAKVYLAWYGYGDYCGSSFVLFEKGGKLYEVNGSHCSGYGLEGQWEPEETSWEALALRDYFGDSYCDGHKDAEEKFKSIVSAHLPKEAA